MKFKADQKRVQLFLWIGLAYLLIWMFNELATNPDTFGVRVINNVWRIAYITVVNYIFFEHVIPALSLRKLFRSFLLLIASMLVFSWGTYGWRELGIQLHIYTSLIEFKSLNHAVSTQMEAAMTSILFFAVVRHFYDHFKLRQTTQQLRIEKQQAELNYLKSQTNPHFLFNTLNNIYSLSKDKSDLAPESVLRLSKILRFMLYETTGAYIAIEQEIKIIDDYIELEKLRYDESLRIRFSTDIEDKKQALPPLLLMPLVENAFKHGVSETREQPFIDIHLAVSKRQLLFEVKNSVGEMPKQEPIRENIGLSNLRRQLELLYKDHHLSLRHEGFVFTAELKINLASHV
ncbi:MAG: histidine kinase [Chitinophagaceae bacterium]|nr:histidine kinase [Chitinophagaceae bacterium]